MQPQPCLSHMPYFIKTQIVESLPMEFRERTPVRMLSKAFKEAVDSSNMRMSLTIDLSSNQTMFNHGTRIIFKENNGSCIVWEKGMSVVPRDFQDVAFEYFTFFTSKPKLIFEKLQIKSYESIENFEITKFVRKFQELFSSRKLKVQTFSLVTLLRSEKDIMRFVPFLDHEILVSLDLLSGEIFTHYQELSETAHWKNLKELVADVTVLSMLSFDSYCHIPRLVIHLPYGPIGRNDWSQWTISFYKHLMYSDNAPESVSMASRLFDGIDILSNPDWTLQAHQSNWLIVDRTREICLCVNKVDLDTSEVKKLAWEELKAIEEINKQKYLSLLTFQ